MVRVDTHVMVGALDLRDPLLDASALPIIHGDHALKQDEVECAFWGACPFCGG
jgi:hypothetical protein